MKYTIAYINANHTVETMTNEYPHKHAAFVAGTNLMVSGKAVSWFVHENEATAKTEAVTRFEKKTGIKITSAPSTKATHVTVPAEPKVTAVPKETLPVHMVVSVEKPDGSKATIQYKNEDKAIAAYRAAKADPANKVVAGYRTVTIRFDGSGLYTYLADRAVKTRTVNVRTEYGMKNAYVVDNAIHTRRELYEMAKRRGYDFINDFFKVLEEV